MTESNLKSNIGNLSNSIDLNMSSQSFGGFARKVYLWMIGLYGCLVFNEFIKRPVDFLALALILLGLPLISRQNLSLLTQVVRHSKPTKLVFYSLFTLSLLFLSSTLNQLPQTEGLIAFGAQYGVHMGLAVVALLVIPLNEQSIRFLNKACLLALFLLALCDVLYFIEQAQAHQILGTDYSHRWFGDGYVFLTPFLLARLLSFYQKGPQESLRAVRLCVLYLFLIMVMLLAGGTGARSTYGIITLELLTFFGIFLWQVILTPSKIPTANLATSQTFQLGALAIPKNWLRAATYCVFLSILLVTIRLMLTAAIPQLFLSTLSRGTLIADRIQHAWGPGIKMITAKPILGHGFGHQAWDLALSSIQIAHPEILNVGSPHNWFLAAGFLGGILAILMQLVFAAALVWGLIAYLRLPPKSFKFLATSKSLALAVLISFIAFYGLRGQVEFTIYKYLSLILIGFGLLQATLYSVSGAITDPKKPKNPKTQKPKNPKTPLVPTGRPLKKGGVSASGVFKDD